MDKNIMLEFPLTSLYEANIISSIKESVFHELYEDNFNVCIVSRDMTSLNTDILNEYCLLINNFSFTILDLVKMNINILENIDIDDVKREELINKLREESNKLL